MKTLYSIIIFYLFATPCFAQKIKSDLEKENLKGNIDSVVTEELTKKGDQSIHIRTVEKFNMQGNLVYTIRYNSSALQDSSAGKTVYEYDSRQRLIRRTQYDLAGKILNKSICTYHSIDNGVEERRYDGDGQALSEARIYKYDEAGNVSLCSILNNHLKIKAHIYYKYDRGNLISEEERSEDGSIIYIKTMGYDAMDNRISEAKTDVNGNKIVKVYHYFNYDKQYNWLSMEEPGNADWSAERQITYYK